MEWRVAKDEQMILGTTHLASTATTSECEGCNKRLGGAQKIRAKDADYVCRADQYGRCGPGWKLLCRDEERLEFKARGKERLPIYVYL